MRRRDLLVGAGGLAGGSSLIVSSNAFTSVEAEREFDVDVVGDDEAYLALHHHYELDGGGRRAATVTCGEDVTLFDIQNRFSDTIDTLDVSVENDDFEISVDSDSLGPGDGDEVRLETDFSNGCQEGPFTVKIEASGDGFSVDAERDFKIEVEVRPQFKCLEATVEPTEGKPPAAESVRFDYVLNVASKFEFEINEKGGGHMTYEPEIKEKSGSVIIRPTEEDFGQRIDIIARIGSGSESYNEKWNRGKSNEITLVDGGCNDRS